MSVHREVKVRDQTDLVSRQFRVRSARHFVGWLFASVIVMASWELVDPSRMGVAWVAILWCGFGLWSLGRCAETGFWSPVSLYFLVFSLFHIGLCVLIVTGIDPALPRASDYQWYEGPAGVRAIYLCVLGMSAFVTTSLLVLALRGRAKVRAEVVGESSSKLFAIVGNWILISSTLLWFALTVRELGIAGLFGAYQDFLAATASSEINLTYPLMGIGLGFSVLAPPGVLGRLALTLFAGFAVIGFFLGLRGEVLFPVAVAASVLAVRTKMPRTVLVAGGLIVLLTLVNAAKQIRQSGLSTSTFSLVDATPLGAIAELGSTLRVVATVVGWHDVNDEPFSVGETYTVSLARGVERFTLGGDRMPASEDFRLFNSEIMNRSGAIGGSVVGEAYHNFAVVGVVLVLGLTGAVFAYFSRTARTASSLATYVVVAMPLFNHIRNSFVPVLPWIIGGVLLVYGVELVSRSRKNANLIRPRSVGA